MTTSLTDERATQVPVAPSAVAWIDHQSAIVAEIGPTGRISTCEVQRGWLTQRAYLLQVSRVIGDRERLLILGPGSFRTLLERAYVATFRRTNRLVDVEPSGAATPDELVERVRVLAA